VQERIFPGLFWSYGISLWNVRFELCRYTFLYRTFDYCGVIIEVCTCFSSAPDVVLAVLNWFFQHFFFSTEPSGLDVMGACWGTGMGGSWLGCGLGRPGQAGLPRRLPSTSDLGVNFNLHCVENASKSKQRRTEKNPYGSRSCDEVSWLSFHCQLFGVIHIQGELLSVIIIVQSYMYIHVHYNCKVHDVWFVICDAVCFHLSAYEVKFVFV